MTGLETSARLPEGSSRHSMIWVERRLHSVTKYLHSVRGKRRGEVTTSRRLRYVPQHSLHSLQC
ncbi:hypothetical protein IG631_01136 [Alternaria alternata]|nr:hypothetical protein IG631_01136 [Alternaria alternata]